MEEITEKVLQPASTLSLNLPENYDVGQATTNGNCFFESTSSLNLPENYDVGQATTNGNCFFESTSSLNLPENYDVGQATTDGNCFFESTSSLNLPENFDVGQAATDGNCFFDSFRQGLKQQSGLEVNVEQLRQYCKEFAQNNLPEWFVNGIANSHDNNGKVRKENPVSYAENILDMSRWGDSDIEGRILCEKFRVKLHVIEILRKDKNEINVDENNVRADQIIDKDGSRSVNNIDYNDETTIHILNKGESHFEPILKISVNIPKPESNAHLQPIPTTTNRVVLFLEDELNQELGWYTEQQINTNPNVLFLFGDNENAKYRNDTSNPGGSGQAQITRPVGKRPYDRLPKDGGINGNAIGITTTFYSGYTPDINEFKILMDKEFEPIEAWVKKGGYVVIPCNSQREHSLGTGKAKLEDKIPGALNYIQYKLKELVRFGEQHREENLLDFKKLKQELHQALFKERQSYGSSGDLQSYLSDKRSAQQKRSRTSSDENSPDDRGPKKSRISSPNHQPSEFEGQKFHQASATTQGSIETEEYFDKNPLGGLIGYLFQARLLMLFLKRALDIGYSFRLATELSAAEKFDDIVFQYTQDSKKVYRFLQAKHKLDESKKISINNLLTENDEDYSLQKYFISYRKIIQKPQFSGENIVLKDFVIYTNWGLFNELENYFEKVKDKDNILDIDVEDKSNDSRRLILKIDSFSKKDEILKILKNTSDLNRLAKELAEHVIDNKQLSLRNPLFKIYHYALKENRVIDVESKKLKSDFIDGKCLYMTELIKFHQIFKEEAFKKIKNDIWTKLKKKKLKLCIGFGKQVKGTKMSVSKDLQYNSKKGEKSKFFLDLARELAEHVMRGKELNLSNTLFKSSHVFLKEKGVIDVKSKKLKRDFITGTNLHEIAEKFRQIFEKEVLKIMKLQDISEELKKEKYELDLSNDFGMPTCEDGQHFQSTLPNDPVNDNEIKEFFKRLVLAVNQPNAKKLEEIIKAELGTRYNSSQKELFFARFQTQIIDWIVKREGKFFSKKEATDFFAKLRKEIPGYR